LYIFLFFSGTFVFFRLTNKTHKQTNKQSDEELVTPIEEEDGQKQTNMNTSKSNKQTENETNNIPNNSQGKTEINNMNDRKQQKQTENKQTQGQ
jgi:hypothetical protein